MILLIIDKKKLILSCRLLLFVGVWNRSRIEFELVDLELQAILVIRMPQTHESNDGSGTFRIQIIRGQSPGRIERIRVRKEHEPDTIVIDSRGFPEISPRSLARFLEIGYP
ncbi:hypothetical protein AR158_c511L [Paramecium bursaria Chlorella virus AR158]|uniref:hypothetical protein n=1 Tax=Paramecium bursaria Chlorella virus AR158 TaxID=380598 RepID=UPI00015AA72D|nr:hypothetical protein AR158_c511L [Paramecium bursaria Chlorella virus AR158]ABU44056.1 hypothetical protein AR158_c511L [Paramecium bursaria Chlorella virus AR158]